MLNLLHLHQAKRQSTKLQCMGWEKPLQRLIDSAKRSWTVSTLLPMPGGCGKACSASQTTRPPRTLISAPQKACRMTSTVSMPASRPPASIQRGGTHTHTWATQPPPPPSYCLINCGTQSAEEAQPPQGSRARQHPWAGPQSLCYRAGRCTRFHL